MDFLVGIILIASGVLLIKYRYPFYHFTGEWGWAQQYLGSNGTIAAISIIGAFLIFVGVAFPLGAFRGEEAPASNSGSTIQTTNVFSRP